MNLHEYTQMQEAEMRQQCRTLYKTYQFIKQDVVLDGQLPITVYNRAEARRYDYVLTQFGVVRWLSDDGVEFDKTPVCYELDKALDSPFYIARADYAAKL